MLNKERATQTSPPPGDRQPAKRRGARAQANTREGQPLVLVVDDFGAAREIYARVLSSSGFQVAEATNGAEALAKGLSLRPELIIVDLGLPGMDGLELIALFKADARTRKTPILVVTGAGYADGERKARQAGCDAYIVKPCVPETLLSVVRELLRPGLAPLRDA